MFLILGWKSNTAADRAKYPDAGQWERDGEPFDFDYVREEVVASGDTDDELIKSAEFYHSLQGKTMADYLAELFPESQNAIRRAADSSVFRVRVWIRGYDAGAYEFPSRAEAIADMEQRAKFRILGFHYELEEPCSTPAA